MSDKKPHYLDKKYLIEEAKDTAKIGRRRAIESASLLDEYFATGEKDKSLVRDGAFQLMQSIELMTKGIIKFYGEEYLRGHETKRNAEVLASIKVVDSLAEINDIVEILRNDGFSYEFARYSNTVRYRNIKLNYEFMKDGQIVRDMLLRYIDRYIID